MVSKATIDQCLYLIKLDKSISVNDDEFLLKCKLFHQVFRHKTDKEFEEATYKVLEDARELYGKLPTIAMYKQKLEGVDLPIDDLANTETTLIVNAISSYWSSLETTCEISIKTVDDLGGLNALKWRLNEENPNKDEIKWIKKEIKDLWLSNARSEHKQKEIIDSCKYLKGLSIDLSSRLSL